MLNEKFKLNDHRLKSVGLWTEGGHKKSCVYEK